MLTTELKERRLDCLKNKTINEATVEECIAGCRQAADIRNKMGGAMYWNMMNEQCHMLYDAAREKGADETTMTELYELLM